jgi:hypothetical protein
MQQKVEGPCVSSSTTKGRGAVFDLSRCWLCRVGHAQCVCWGVKGRDQCCRDQCCRDLCGSRRKQCWCECSTCDGHCSHTREHTGVKYRCYVARDSQLSVVQQAPGGVDVFTRVWLLRAYPQKQNNNGMIELSSAVCFCQFCCLTCMNVGFGLRDCGWLGAPTAEQNARKRWPGFHAARHDDAWTLPCMALRMLWMHLH